jgi:hypothetical protein
MAIQPTSQTYDGDGTIAVQPLTVENGREHKLIKYLLYSV